MMEIEMLDSGHYAWAVYIGKELIQSGFENDRDGMMRVVRSEMQRWRITYGSELEVVWR